MAIGADVLLRACAIILVTYNHAHPFSGSPLGWGGGMTFLMMLSGYNFAKFGMENATPESGRLALFRLGWRILVPSFIAVVFFFVLLRKFNLEELLFYRNWITLERVSKFPTWYPQVIVQMFAGLLLMFSLPGVARAIFRYPLRASLILFALATLIRVVLPRIWDTAPLHHNLPHLFLWNFTLGWVVYFSMAQLSAPWNRLVSIGCAVTGGAVAWGIHALDFWFLSVGVALLVVPMNLRLWSPLARFFFIVSQATFGIFLLHRFVYEIYEHMPIPQNQDAEWLIGLFGSLALWMAGVVPVRAYRALRQQRPPATSVALMQRLSGARS